MTWGFATEPEFQEKLDWVAKFTREEIEPIDRVIEHALDVNDPVRNTLVKPLQQIVRQQGLWACHLGPDLGGQGYGQLKLALLNEIIGRTHSGPVVFGTQAPDSGNAEILAHFGSPELKQRYLAPIIENEIVSCFSMTEPEGGSDPTELATTAVLDGEEWVINGEKWFSSHARFASFFIVMAATDPDAARHNRASMFVVPACTPGLEIIRNVGVWGHDSIEGTHAYVRYTDVRIPKDHILGERGHGFAVAQIRLGGGRIHHAMRTIGLVGQALDMMVQRAVTRRSGSGHLGDRQMVQEMIADSFIQLQQFRLLVLQTAWRIDQYGDYRKVIADISAVKAAMPKVLAEVVGRAIQLHGALGTSTELPLGKWLLESYHMAIADGATEIHKVQIAKQLMRGIDPYEGVFPPYHLPAQEAAAREKFRDVLG